MQIVLYIIAGLSMLMGVFILVTASKYQFKHLGLTFGGLTYLIGGLFSINMLTWWPVIGAWILAFGIRKIFGDPTKE
jgi:hypothetical protein